MIFYTSDLIESDVLWVRFLCRHLNVKVKFKRLEWSELWSLQPPTSSLSVNKRSDLSGDAGPDI